jgi:Holliday junction resolvasome RuvABC endonuclease subunit
MSWLGNGPAVVLGIHPSSRGFGWVALEGPLSVYDSGLCAPKPKGQRDAACLRKVKWLLERLKPEAVVLEAFDRGSSMRSESIRALCARIVALVRECGVPVEIYPRSDVQAMFRAVGAETRDEVAEAVARSFSALRHRLPRRRGTADREDHRLTIFSATAVVLTYYENGATAFLDSLRNAA